MQQSNHHIIAKQTIELRLTGVENGFEWNQKISDFCNKKLNKALEKLFDKYSEKENITRLDKLEIDLGRLNQTTLDDELVSKIISRLDEQLYKLIKLGNTTVDGRFIQVTKESIRESGFNDWLYYLQFGVLPFHADRLKNRDFDKEIISFLAKETPAREKFRNILQKSKIAVARLILQHPDVFLQELVTSYTAVKQDRLLDLFTDFKLFEEKLIRRLEKFGKETKGSLKRSTGFIPVSQRMIFWKEIINYYILSDDNRTSPSKQHLEEIIVNLVINVVNRVISIYEVNYRQVDNDTPFWQEALIIDKTSYPLINQLSEAHKKVLQQNFKKIFSYSSDRSNQFDKDVLNDNNEIDNQLKKLDTTETILPDWEADSSEVPVDEKKLTDRKADKITEEKDTDSSPGSEEKYVNRATIISAEIEKNRTEKTTAPKARQTDQDKIHYNDNVQQDENALKEREFAKVHNIQNRVKEGESFYIQNAGVVLLNPFLATFLKKLSLVHDNDFTNDYSRQKAVHIIHYLATGQTGLPDYDLLLPKLLCGLSFEVPIDRFIELEKEETEEANHLISTIIKHWGALGNASPDALREGFLQRDGKLEKVNNGWRLYVEQNTIDILLSKLPYGWGLGTIKLPWMEEILYVEWG